MKKTLLLTGVLLALTASLASAAAPGLSMAWAPGPGNTCPSNAVSLLDVSNTCQDNSGVPYPLIGSIVSPGVTTVVGEQIVIDMQEATPVPGAPLSDWWNFDINQCRGDNAGTGQASSLVLNAVFLTSGNKAPCNNLWKTAASGATSYQSNNTAPGKAHITGAFAVSTGAAWPAGTEWYSFNITIDGNRTIDDPIAGPHCPGCLDGACFTFNYAQIIAPAGIPSPIVTNPTNKGQSASYNGGGYLNCSQATPAKRATWGQVKSLYR